MRERERESHLLLSGISLNNSSHLHLLTWRDREKDYLSNLDTNGAEESVIVSEVSSFQRLKCMQEWYLGWEKVSCLERCPHRERGSTVHTLTERVQ